MKTKIKAIIFDMDETLIHPDTGLYEEYVIERAKDFARVFNIADLDEAKRLAFKMKIEECDDSTILLYDKMKISRDKWFDKVNAIDVKPYLKKNRALKLFLKTLKQKGLLLFLLTNSPRLQTTKILQATGIPVSFFNQMFTWGKNTEPPKPSSKPFHTVLKKYKLNPKECLMVGNEIKVDLRMAHSLNITTIGINLETERDKSVDFEIDKLDDILEVIDTIEK